MSNYKEIIVKEYHDGKGLLTRREIGEEIVRCKNCKKRNTRTCMMNNNVGMNKDLFDDDYCSYGKRKERDHE